MQCPKCGTEITREDIIAEDAVQCPGCGAVYRRRSSSKDAPQHAKEQTAQHREKPKASSDEMEQNPYRMRCRFCGTEINTQITEPDGSVVCPGCGMIYRRKESIAQSYSKETRNDIKRKAPSPSVETQPRRYSTRHIEGSRQGSDAGRHITNDRKRTPAAISLTVLAMLLVICGLVAFFNLLSEKKQINDASGTTSPAQENIYNPVGAESRQVLSSAGPTEYVPTMENSPTEDRKELEWQTEQWAVTDSAGYTILYTLRYSSFARIDNTEYLQPFWSEISTDSYPSKSSLQKAVLSRISRNYTDLYCAVGEISAKNLTNGWSFSSSNPYNAGFCFSIRQDNGNTVDNGLWGRVYYSNGDTIDTHTSYGVEVAPYMKSNHWGPVPIVLMLPEELSPNYPEGRFKSEYESNAYIVYTGVSFKSSLDTSAYGDLYRRIPLKFIN